MNTTEFTITAKVNGKIITCTMLRHDKNGNNYSWEWGRNRTGDYGRGLWLDDQQVEGTMQWRMPRQPEAAYRYQLGRIGTVEIISVETGE